GSSQLRSRVVACGGARAPKDPLPLPRREGGRDPSYGAPVDALVLRARVARRRVVRAAERLPLLSPRPYSGGRGPRRGLRRRARAWGRRPHAPDAGTSLSAA